MAYTNIPYLVEGEILLAQSHRLGERVIVRYTCVVTMPDGSHIIVPNVRETSSFGGVADYTQRRARETKELKFRESQQEADATLGERVLIAFVNGNIANPIIVSYVQHPNQMEELNSPDTLKPQSVFQYLGVRMTIDETGQFQCIHRGVPDVKAVPNPTLGMDIPGSSALSLLEAKTLKNSSNIAVTPKPTTEVTLWEFLDGGIFRIRDALGQIIEINRTIDDGRIYISNNDLKSTENASANPLSGGLQYQTNSTDAEYVWLDRKKKLVLINARKIIQLYSFGVRKDVTEKDHSHKILGNSEWQIGGDDTHIILGNRSIKITKNFDTTVGGDTSLTGAGSYNIKIAKDLASTIGGSSVYKYLKDVDIASMGDYKITSVKDVLIEGSAAKIKLSKGKVAIGSNAAELLDLINQELTAFIQNAAAFVFTKSGEGQLSPAILTALTKIQTLLGSIKGSF